MYSKDDRKKAYLIFLELAFLFYQHFNFWLRTKYWLSSIKTITGNVRPSKKVTTLL